MKAFDAKALVIANRLCAERADGTFTACELGCAIWRNPTHIGDPKQPYARPAGNVIKRLMAEGRIAVAQRRLPDGNFQNVYRTVTPPPLTEKTPRTTS